MLSLCLNFMHISGVMRLSNTILDAALEYASRGWAVFPLKPDANIGIVVGRTGGEENGGHR